MAVIAAPSSVRMVLTAGWFTISFSFCLEVRVLAAARPAAEESVSPSSRFIVMSFLK